MNNVTTGVFLRSFLRAPAHLYHWRLGWLFGHRFLLLTHVGRRTGTRFHTVLEVLEYRPQSHEAVVMSGFGRNANWLRNIEANACVEIEIGLNHFRASFRFLDENEAVRVLAGYERRNRFIFPIVRLVLSRLLGWAYCGSDADRRKLVRDLPLVAFQWQQ